MKSYLTWSAEDFACDDEFVLWVKYPDHYPHLDTFWRNWLGEHPEKKEVVEEARLLVMAFVAEKPFVAGSARKKAIWQAIQSTAALPEEKVVPLWHRWYMRAAVVVFSAMIGWFAFQFKAEQQQVAVVTEPPMPEFVRHVNNAETAKTIILGDGTSIILQPQSTLEYPEVFSDDVREVHLTGQGFFDVVRDPNRPFLVHAGEIVTRVLGTSFTVRNVAGESNVLVQVKTGKVSVFMADQKARRPDSGQNVEGVILMPNQQVLYERGEMKMTKSLVEDPVVLVPVPAQEFEFVDAPIKNVFGAIEAAYGVEIVFDEEALSTCYLNASLSDVPLYDKLKLICKGINATYEIIDSHIIIYGKGCSNEIVHQNHN